MLKRHRYRDRQLVLVWVSWEFISEILLTTPYFKVDLVVALVV